MELQLRKLAAVAGLATIGILGGPLFVGTAVANPTSPTSAISGIDPHVPAVTGTRLPLSSGDLTSLETGTSAASGAPASSLGNSSAAGAGAVPVSNLTLTGSGIMALFVGGLAVTSVGFLILTFLRRRVRTL